MSTLAPVLIKPFLNPPNPQGLNVGCGLAEGTRLNLLQCVLKSPPPTQTLVSQVENYQFLFEPQQEQKPPKQGTEVTKTSIIYSPYALHQRAGMSPSNAKGMSRAMCASPWDTDSPRGCQGRRDTRACCHRHSSPKTQKAPLSCLTAVQMCISPAQTQQ